MNEPFFVINNKHSDECGVPAKIDNNDYEKYVGYFQNLHGDQWTFVYNRKTKSAELHGGDAGWDKVWQVEKGVVANLVLSTEESAWLKSC